MTRLMAVEVTCSACTNPPSQPSAATTLDERCHSLSARYLAKQYNPPGKARVSNIRHRVNQHPARENVGLNEWNRRR
jgi:hypothetical protein